MSLKEKLNEAIELREQGRAQEKQELIEKSRRILFELLEDNHSNPEINYQIGVSFDNSGYTKDAIPFYKKAIELKLNQVDLERCYLGLGSSYRLLGCYTEAVEVLETAVTEYPENRALQTFLSIAYYNTGRHKESLQLALNNLLDTTADEKVIFFKRPLEYYANHLDEVWNPDFYDDDKN